MGSLREITIFELPPSPWPEQYPVFASRGHRQVGVFKTLYLLKDCSKFVPGMAEKDSNRHTELKGGNQDNLRIGYQLSYQDLNKLLVISWLGI
jgi:hypothetical protein